jgi:energy-coupling factor transporter ATP-binding protein EcfA2
MLTSIKIRNFKKFEEIEFELGKTVVLIGPNNSGKTAALQALALWNIGLTIWNSKRGDKSSAKERTGVTINRRDLNAIQVPDSNLLWKNLDIRRVTRINGKQDTKNVRLEISVAGITDGKYWCSGLEFDYANPESFYCRPLRLTDSELNGAKQFDRMHIPDEALKVKVSFLPPMSGLADREYLKQPGEIGVLLGQGQTAQVLRNLCYNIHQSKNNNKWDELGNNIFELFGINLLPPKYMLENSEITMDYKERNIKLDLSASGRGLQQTILLLAHLYANPETVLLLDEPDAHLEILRQQQIYQLITDIAEKNGSQLIIASHSEVVLNEAAGRNVVIAFVGKPHRIDDQSQAMKSLKSIGYDQYYLAEQRGWVLYLEGSTDLAILRSFADRLNHPAKNVLERPFTHYVENQPPKAEEHFYGLREAKPDLLGIALFDRLDRDLTERPGLVKLMWKRKEIENYLCMEEVLISYARHDLMDDLFGQAEADRREQIMRECIQQLIESRRVARKPNPWSPDTKATDEFLDPLFENYFEKLQLPNLLRKTNYHSLAKFVPREKIDPEITEKLDLIVQVAQSAKPRED